MGTLGKEREDEHRTDRSITHRWKELVDLPKSYTTPPLIPSTHHTTPVSISH